MHEISWDDFEKVQLRVGEVIDVEGFPEAQRPALKLKIDFGASYGVKRSSAQITKHYHKDNLLGKQVICVVNFPPKQIGKFISEVLVTGFADENGDIVLATVDKSIPNGGKLH